MAPVRVHELVSPDGVIDAPVWTADGLVDELHLFVYPVTRGSGLRLLGADAAAATWRRTSAELYDNGVTYAKLAPAS